jgi:hypothetical protein
MIESMDISGAERRQVIKQAVEGGRIEIPTPSSNFLLLID